MQMLRAGDARAVLAALQPKPWPTDRQAVLKSLTGGDGLVVDRPGHVFWLSDGVSEIGLERLVAPLRSFGAVTMIADPAGKLAKVLHPPVADGDRLAVTAQRAAAGSEETAWVAAVAEDGRLLAREALRFAAGAATAEARIVLPAELRNRLASLQIEGETTAGGVVLVDERWRRRPVGLVAGEGSSTDQPLLSSFYYLERALTPFTEVRRDTVSNLLGRELAVMILADPGRLDDGARGTLERWIETGGVAVRFAGPNLAQDGGALLPVRLRRGDRVMGGTLSWDEPAALATFQEGSPFFGLDTPPDVKVGRQVLAQPSLDLAAKTWARLSDGTPLVTAEKRGKGWLILVHTTANPSWSNLPLSGLFVGMLQRIVALSQGVVARTDTPPLAPLEMLDSFGRLGSAPASALPIAAGDFTSTVVEPAHPPGYYGEKSARRALNLAAGLTEHKAVETLPSGMERQTYGAGREVDFQPWLLAAALLLAVVDLLVSLALRGLLRFGTFAAGLALVVLSQGAAAQVNEEMALAASLQTRLAYVLTGDAQVDETSRAGLAGLGLMATRRTAAELGAPVGIDPGTDELVFYPLLYWPLTAGQAPPTARAASRLNTYLRNGGTILIDTRDRDGGSGGVFMRALVRVLDIPPLVPVGPDHVLTRSFYLLRELPGRWAGGPVWVEESGERINDGVSPIIVGAHDWAAAWAMDDTQRPLYAVVPGGERQREMAFRFGINLLMYALTGNYKADQVHLPAILQRLEQ
jgi:hypothetical protein